MDYTKFVFDDIDSVQKGDLIDTLASWKARRILLEGHRKAVDRKLEEAVKMTDALDLLTGYPFAEHKIRLDIDLMVDSLGRAVREYRVGPEAAETISGHAMSALYVGMRERYAVTEEEIAENAEKIVDLLVIGRATDAIAFRLRVEFDGDVDAFLDRYAAEMGLVKAVVVADV